MSTLIRGTALLNFADLVTSLGGEAEQLLRARGVDPAAAGDFDRFLSSARAAAVVADAAEALDCRTSACASLACKAFRSSAQSR